MRRLSPLMPAFVLTLLAGIVSGSDTEKTERPARPGPNSADEPLAKTPSPAAAARFLDAVAAGWTRERKCATCHTNVVYLLARPALKGGPSEETVIVRRFFEERVAHWDDPDRKAKPRNDSEIVVTAVALAFHDAQTTGKLHPLTRKALDRMWTRQQADGAWDWVKCTWPPLEHDDYFGAVFAALGAAIAPEGYARTEPARRGLAKLGQYLRDTSAPTLHHQAWFLWAAQKHDGLMTAAERERTLKEFLARQRADGGWSLPSLGHWEGFDGRENDRNAPSDGYATGLVIYVLRQASLPARHAAIRRGVHWLETNQRASGRWFTRSLNTDRAHYISHAGTAFALMALKACEQN